jgi:hypothetical protein
MTDSRRTGDTGTLVWTAAVTGGRQPDRRRRVEGGVCSWGKNERSAALRPDGWLSLPHQGGTAAGSRDLVANGSAPTCVTITLRDGCVIDDHFTRPGNGRIVLLRRAER